jgi:acetyltransferase
MTQQTEQPSSTARPVRRVDRPGLSRQVCLPGGQAVTLRPIRPDDEEAELDFVHRLSPDSRYLRFMAPIKDVTPAMLERLTHIDLDKEMALVAVASTAEGERQVGVARYSILEDARSCEFAIVVDDLWRGTGLARELMSSLMDIARHYHGLEAMEGVAFADNQRMLGLAHSMGFRNMPDPEDRSLVRMRRRLRSPAESSAPSTLPG